MHRKSNVDSSQTLLHWLHSVGQIKHQAENMSSYHKSNCVRVLNAHDNVLSHGHICGMILRPSLCYHIIADVIISRDVVLEF